MPQTHDIAILGATAAGYAAAYHLARKRLSVIVVDAPASPSESPLADWIPKGFFSLSGLPRSLLTGAKATAFKTVTYHSADFQRTAEYRSRGAAGYFVDSQRLLSAMKSAAVKAKVAVKAVKSAPKIVLEEDCVRLGQPANVRASLLIIAQSQPAAVIGDLALPVQTVPRSPMVVAGLDVPLSARTATRTFDGSLHVVETRDRAEIGMFFPFNASLHLRMISASAASGTRAAELSAMLTNLQKAGLIPSELAVGKARGAIWYPPAGVALELETHVAKRCLLAGTAGGFAEAITGQTIAPTVRSALLAADIAAAALENKAPQESLIKYKNVWRRELADYLRPPNTALQMLLPLLFVNKQIVAKFTAALLYGQNI